MNVESRMGQTVHQNKTLATEIETQNRMLELGVGKLALGWLLC